MSDTATGTSESEASGGSVRLRIAISAVIGFVVATGLVWYVSGSPSLELLPRIEPTLAGGGVGTDWSTGRAAPVYNWLIWATKAAVAIAGLSIFYMVLMHWMAFRRLAARMQSPEGSRAQVSTDGGRPVDEGGDEE